MSITKTLQELDDEIELRRQQINVLRVEIAQIEEARRTQLWLSEERTRRRDEMMNGGLLGKKEPLQLVVRERKEPPPQLNGGTPHVVKNKDGNGRPPGTNWRERVLDFMSGTTEPVTVTEIAQFYGIRSGDDRERRRMRQALHSLRVAGRIKASAKRGPGDAGSYALAPGR